MIENSHINRWVMREGEKANARPDAGAQDADALKSLLLQPAHGRARIEHCLTHRLDRASNVRSHEVIGAFQFRWAPLFVIRQSQPQRGHAQTVENTASLDVTVRLCVPLRQYDDGRARFFLALPSRPKQ